MHLDKLQRGEMIASVCGLILAASLFLPWYSTDSSNPNSMIKGMTGNVSAWDPESVIRFLLLLAAVAPLILTWIILRQHELSWPRGELTAVATITVLVLILVVGMISRPGETADTISLEVGWSIALVASVGMFAGAAQRSAQSGERPRRPPGAL
jgi:hypothetical protein